MPPSWELSGCEDEKGRARRFHWPMAVESGWKFSNFSSRPSSTVERRRKTLFCTNSKINCSEIFISSSSSASSSFSEKGENLHKNYFLAEKFCRQKKEEHSKIWSKIENSWFWGGKRGCKENTRNERKLREEKLGSCSPAFPTWCVEKRAPKRKRTTESWKRKSTRIETRDTRSRHSFRKEPLSLCYRDSQWLFKWWARNN